MVNRNCTFMLYTRQVYHTVSPKKHGDSVTIFTLSISAQLDCKINGEVACPASPNKVD